MSETRFKPSAPFSEAEIREIESVLGRALPGDYCEFVKEYGGAFVGGLIDGDAELPIMRFYGPDQEYGVLFNLKTHPDLRDEGSLPFADCALGNIWAMDRENIVYYIDYYGGPPTARKVADSFRDLITRIVVSEE